MSNPYSTPGQQGPDEYREHLSADARQLQLVTSALAMSILVMMGMFLGLNEGELILEPEMMSWLAVGMAAVMTLNSFIIPSFVTQAQLKRLDPSELRAAETPDKFAMVSPTFRPGHITGCAILEGAAVMNLVSYMITSFVGNLAAASLMLVLILFRFPTANRISFWTQDRIRELELA